MVPDAIIYKLGIPVLFLFDSWVTESG